MSVDIRRLPSLIAHLALAFLAAGCQDHVTEIQKVGSVAVDLQAAAQSRPGWWTDRSDEDIWSGVMAVDTLLVVGIKDPRAERGLVNGKPTASRTQWLNAIRHFAADPHARLVQADSEHLPIVTLRPRNFGAFQAIRRLPFVAFVEPAGGTFQLASTCSPGDPYPYSQIAIPMLNGSGADSVPYIYSNMNAVNAMRIADGNGTIVGVIDSGLDGTPGSEWDPTYWTGRVFQRVRSHENLLIDQQSQPSCAHGTRITGIVSAPRNGRGMLGLAPQAGLINVEAVDKVLFSGDVLAARITHGIRYAAEQGAQVIVIALGSTDGYAAIGWEIEHQYEFRGVTFVAAAGTCPAGYPFSCPSSPVFPAWMTEVLAVTGSDHNGMLASNAFGLGSKGGAFAYTFLSTTTPASPQLVHIEGSSGATAFVGGLAALVKTRYPALLPQQVMQRIQRTSGQVCGAPFTFPYSMVNASAAVGGPCVSHILQGTLSFYSGESNSYIVNVVRSFADGFQLGGSGRYRVEWSSTGGTVANVPLVTGDGTDQNGSAVWSATQNFSFLPSYDGLPYRVRITAIVRDEVLGTLEYRHSDWIRVCANAATCYDTQRVFPGYGSFAVDITGPTTINSAGTYEWTANVAFPISGYSIVWEQSLDGGASWGQVAGETIYRRTIGSAASYNLLLRVRATGSSGETTSDIHSVAVGTCGPSCENPYSIPTPTRPRCIESEAIGRKETMRTKARRPADCSTPRSVHRQ